MSRDIRVLTRKPKYPPIKDGNQVAYLLLHVNVPSDRWPVPSVRQLDGVESAQKAGKILGIKIWPMRLVWSKDKRGYYRYFFRFSRHQRDDQRAQQIAECFLHALALTSGPFMDPNEIVSVFRVPADLVRKSHIVSGDKLVQVEEARSYDARTLESPHRILGIASSTTGEDFDAAWKITPVLLQNEELYRAVRFLKASQDDFFVWPGQISGVIDNPDLTASTSFEQIGLENALQNAFKSVEAVLGDPPKDNAKFFAKMVSIGLEPNEEVGYTNKVPLHTVIREMNKARDKKAAHGSTPHRTITGSELMEYQACAHLVVWVAIENKLDERIYD